MWPVASDDTCNASVQEDRHDRNCYHTLYVTLTISLIWFGIRKFKACLSSLGTKISQEKEKQMSDISPYNLHTCEIQSKIKRTAFILLPSYLVAMPTIVNAYVFRRKCLCSRMLSETYLTDSHCLRLYRQTICWVIHSDEWINGRIARINQKLDVLSLTPLFPPHHDPPVTLPVTLLSPEQHWFRSL